jgi:6-phosphogluconolactonase
MRKITADIEIVDNPKELARIGAELFVNCAKTALIEKSKFTVVLSGGETPRPLYERLATDPSAQNLPWEKIHFFWGDERNVPMDHPDSNFHMALTAMLSRLPIPEKNIHRLRTELKDPALVAGQYEKTIREFFNLKGPQDVPHFDLTFLGLGKEGHTASLFPDGNLSESMHKEEAEGLVIAPWISHLREFRFSLTPRAINSSAQIVFLVSGEEKASIIRAVIEGDSENLHFPAQTIQPLTGNLLWLIDKAAAHLLKVGNNK